MKLSVQDLNSHYGPAHILFDIALEVGDGEVAADAGVLLGVVGEGGLAGEGLGVERCGCDGQGEEGGG